MCLLERAEGEFEQEGPKGTEDGFGPAGKFQKSIRCRRVLMIKGLRAIAVDQVDRRSILVCGQLGVRFHGATLLGSVQAVKKEQRAHSGCARFCGDEWKAGWRLSTQPRALLLR